MALCFFYSKCFNSDFIGTHINFLNIHSQKKRYKSCHWGCTFSKGTVLYPKAAYWYLSGTLAPEMYILAPKMYILVPKMYILPHEMYILAPEMYILPPKMYILTPKMYILIKYYLMNGHIIS